MIQYRRRMSIEMERLLLYRPGIESYPPLGVPYGAATPSSLQQVLQELAERGWEPVTDPHTGVLTRVAKRCHGAMDLNEAWNCTSDVTTGIFETTLVPSSHISHLELQQRELDAEVGPLLEAHGLFLMNFETPPAIAPTRDHYFLFHTYWRGDYAFRRQRGEDHYWFSWMIGNSPCIDVSVGEAIPFLRLIHRLTGVTFLFRRLGPISGGRPCRDGRLAVRPWAYRNLWKRSPYPSDRRRVSPPLPELIGWKEYFSFLAGLRLVSLTGEDQRPQRVEGDPTFTELWRGGRVEPWRVMSVDGRLSNIEYPALVHLSQIQRQVYLSRLRWSFDRTANLSSFGQAYDAGEMNLRAYLGEHLERLYIEIRSDSCPPPGEECATLAFYIGLLENLESSLEYVVERRTWTFWQHLFAHAEYGSIDDRIHGEWIPDVLHALLDLSRCGLLRREMREERYLQPLQDRVERLTTPADEALEVFRRAGGGDAGMAALANQYCSDPRARRPLPQFDLIQQ